MEDQLHIIIAGDRGKVVRIPCNKKKLMAVCAGSLAAFLVVTITSFFSLSFYAKHRSSSAEIAKLQEELKSNTNLIATSQGSRDQELHKLEAKIARLELAGIQQATAFSHEKEALLTNAVDKLSERSELIIAVISGP